MRFLLGAVFMAGIILLADPFPVEEYRNRIPEGG